MYKFSKANVLIVSVGTKKESLHLASNYFAHEILYVIHTKISSANNDKRMQDQLLQNQQYIKSTYPSAQFIELDLYNFFYNVSIIRSYLIKHTNDNIVCDITGGDKIVTDAILYARLLENKNEKIDVFYQKRSEDVQNNQNQFIQLSNLPTLTKKQNKIMKFLENSKTIEEISIEMNITKNNAWNFVKELKSKNLVNVGYQNLVISKLPYNYYNTSNIEKQMHLNNINKLIHQLNSIKLQIHNVFLKDQIIEKIDDYILQLQQYKDMNNNDHTI